MGPGQNILVSFEQRIEELKKIVVKIPCWLRELRKTPRRMKRPFPFSKPGPRISLFRFTRHESKHIVGHSPRVQ